MRQSFRPVKSDASPQEEGKLRHAVRGGASLTADLLERGLQEVQPDLRKEQKREP